MMEVCEDSRFFFGQADLLLAYLDFKNYRKRKFSSHKSSAYRFRPFTQLAMSASLLPRLNRWPSSQVPASTNSASSSPLWPMPEETEVQNGMTVLRRDIRISAKEVEKLLSRLFFLPKNSKEGGRHHEV